MCPTDNVDVRRLAYPRMAEGLVGSVNALASGTGTVVLRDGGSAWTVRARLPPEAYESSLTLGMCIGGSRERVRLDDIAVETLLGGVVAAPLFKALDKELQAAVLEAALAGPLTALRRWLAVEVVLEDVLSAEAGAAAVASQPAVELLFDIGDPTGGVQCSVLLELSSPLPAATVEALAGAASRRDCGDVPVPVTFELGSAEVSAADLESLSPGDIVLFDRCYRVGEALRVNVAGRAFRMGTPARGRVTIWGEASDE